MTEQQLKVKLHQLQSLQAENEIVEFKEANNNYDFNKLGKYFSALSNEANLHKAACAWLVFGIENKKHTIVGTKYRQNRADLDNLKRKLLIKQPAVSHSRKFMNWCCPKAGYCYFKYHRPPMDHLFLLTGIFMAVMAKALCLLI